MPKYSLLILTHNRHSAARECFESLEPIIMWDQVQTVVLDNASTDESLKEYLRLEVPAEICFNPVNLGVAAGREALLKWATGDVLIFLDSDVVAQDEGWLERLAEALAPENVGMVGPAGSFVQWRPEVEFHPAPVGECDVVSGWCQAFKRECLEAGVGLDLRYGNFWEEDSDFCLQIRQAGWDVVCTGGIGLRHKASLSGDTGVRKVNLDIFRDKWEGKRLIRAEGAY